MPQMVHDVLEVTWEDKEPIRSQFGKYQDNSVWTSCVLFYQISIHSTKGFSFG